MSKREEREGKYSEKILKTRNKCTRRTSEREYKLQIKSRI
jgi:hypothetical protein